MCLCESCQCMDETFCSLKGKALFLGMWTLAHGILLPMGTVLYMRNVSLGVLIFGSILFVIHIVAGILLLVGVLKSMAKIFLVGVVLSSLVPYIYFFTFYLPVVQVMFTIASCRYYSVGLK